MSIDHIFLMVDDDAEVDLSDGRVTVIEMDGRPTYQDWTQLSQQYCPHSVSVLANADIFFDHTLARLKELFESDPTGFVALSRYELIDGATSLHPNPHWSQDTWAYYPAKGSNPDRDQRLNFPLGVPRCDNKVAYVFSIYGHTVYNPCRQVRSIHVHETGLRNYDKKADMRIVGGMAMVHASATLLDPAQLDIEIWPVKTGNYSQIKLNKSLEKWAGERGLTLPPEQGPAPRRGAQAKVTSVRGAPKLTLDGNVAAYNHLWQFPAITEQHAYQQVRLQVRRDLDAMYFGFPWATLIDLSLHNQTDIERLDALRRGMSALTEVVRGTPRVATVCQHIHMLKFQELFSAAGVSDVFWSHATQGLEVMPDAPNVRIHPFPLYPVQVPHGGEIAFEHRRYLFSFVGAKANNKYLTQSRTYLIEELADHPRGLIRNRDAWHYNKVVYDQQILSKIQPGDALVDERASEEFREILAQSVFTLCPSGTGPNSIRLWEAIAGGSIPVVLADTYKPPASPDLWNQAVITCPESREAVRDLPGRLAAIMRDHEQLRRRRFALRMLAQRYGPRNFVSDVLAFMASGEMKSPGSRQAA
ncbi:exostosin family protein [Hyphobacterium vulgare]|uniref:Exostosin family protein n=2 Tax=Maricaulaceae TaxID=2800061 RepID=A0ABV6ZYL8_9PROT